jgi:phosphatidylserine/phosphatidylglycerophosphate/cardiolipin synthase-like enzyme
MIVDSVLYLFGFNFTKADIDRSRSFAISTRDGAALKEAAKLFEADLTRQPYAPSKSNLVTSPDTARAMLKAFITGAKKELSIYDTKIDDAEMLKLLKEKVDKGVKVRVIGTIKKGSDIGVLNRKLPRRLHVRAIVRDGTRAFVGSQSLRKNELDNRREVGLIVNNPSVARKLLQVFEEDWESAEVKDQKAEKKAAKLEKKKAAA